MVREEPKHVEAIIIQFNTHMCIFGVILNFNYLAGCIHDEFWFDFNIDRSMHR